MLFWKINSQLGLFTEPGFSLFPCLLLFYQIQNLQQLTRTKMQTAQKRLWPPARPLVPLPALTFKPD